VIFAVDEDGNVEMKTDRELYKVSTTRNRRPLKLIYWEGCLNQQDAASRERYLKTTWGKRYIKSRLKEYITGQTPKRSGP
jgi:predicted GIY-YIG superfamily endonuclease